MRFINKQLTIFQRKHSNHRPVDSFTVISWHPNWSITWSWVIDWHKNYIKYGKPFYYIRLNGYKGWYFSCGIKLSILGHFSFSNQPTLRKRSA